MLNIRHINALNRMANAYGRTWKTTLHQAWLQDGHNLPRISTEDFALLRQVRNTQADILASFKPTTEDFERVGVLKKDHRERFNLKKGWHANAWRIVSEDGNDLIQPWCNTKGEARALAKTLKIYLLETE